MIADLDFDDDIIGVFDSMRLREDLWLRDKTTAHVGVGIVSTRIEWSSGCRRTALCVSGMEAIEG
jgi:hypothetical protein